MIAANTDRIRISDLPRRRISALVDKKTRPAGRVTVRSYDAAATNRHTKQHFLYADGRDADSLIREDIATLRNRCRYEIRNNSYAKGMVETKRNDLVGSGPRLQVISEDADFNRRVELLFSMWCGRCDIEGRLTFADMIGLAGSLQQDESGEGLLVFESAEQAARRSWTDSPNEPDVTLRLRVVEPDRLASPGFYDDGRVRDGIEYDANGRAVYYYILKTHPGSDRTAAAGMYDYDKVPASQVIHLYRAERPGQSRGVPWISPGLPVLAYLRRFTLATVAAAEQAANISAVIEHETTGSEFGDDNSSDIEEMDEIEIARNAMLTLPSNAKMQQFKPEQPSSTYKEFKRELINEFARCVNMPYNVAAANSSGYNYASGRLDWQVYYRFIRTVRRWLAEHMLDRIFGQWLREAMLTEGMGIPRAPAGGVTIQWIWPGAEHVDPLKEAAAQGKRLDNTTTTLAAEYALQGKDWEVEVRQKAKEKQLLEELGLTDEGKVGDAAMENIARGVRAGVPIGVGEARTALGLSDEPPDDKLLRFNDQDVLQYHIESGVLTINEVREVLGLSKVDWGDVPVRKAGVTPVNISGSNQEADEEEPDESETDAAEGTEDTEK